MKKYLIILLLFVGCKGGTPTIYYGGKPILMDSSVKLDSISLVYKISHDTIFIHDTVYRTKVVNIN